MMSWNQEELVEQVLPEDKDFEMTLLSRQPSFAVNENNEKR